MAENKINTPVEPEVKKLEVDPGVLEGILGRLEAAESALKEKDSQIEILKDSVSRSRLEQAEESRRPKGLPQAYLKLYNGKVVIAEDWVGRQHGEYVYNPMQPNTPAGERLKIKLTFVDGTQSQEIDYVEFRRITERVIIEKVGEESAIDSKGNAFTKWVVQCVDKSIYSEKFSVDPYYINP